MARLLPGKENKGKANRGTRTLRRRTSSIIVLTTMALIAALVFAAVSADGREVSRASSNDGGAWLINRELSVVGHKNRTVGEMSSFIRIDTPRPDVHQFGDFVIVHDEALNQIIEVDTRAFSDDLEPTELPAGTRVHAVDGAAIVTRADPITVWRIPANELTTLPNLDSVAQLHTGAGPGSVAVRADGTIVVVDHDRMASTWYFSDGAASETSEIGIDPTEQIVDLTIVDGTAIALLGSGNLALVDTNGDLDLVSLEGSQLARLQQPSGTTSAARSNAAMTVAAVSNTGELLALGLADGQATVTVRGELAGTAPLAPVAHDGCIYGVVTEPPTLGVTCDSFASRELQGAGSELRLRLVNGWVWVNDLADGGTWVTNDELRIETLEDWGRAEPTAQQSPDEPEDDDGGNANDSADQIIVENPDADGAVQNSDDYDPTEENVPPIAVEDAARTRVDRSVVVDVLANDTDLNNDILVVSGVRLSSGQALVTPTASLEAVQVTPGPGFVGTIQFTYDVSDGRSEPVSAAVVVDVLSNEQANRPPVAVTDVVATAPGNATTIDLLRNDSDPDGDALALASVTTETGTLRWDPSGQVTFTPDTTTAAGWIELPYVVADDLGAETEGVLRVEIRDRGANQEPDARNDQATTVVGRPVALDLLFNDSDPDGDPLLVSSRPRLLSPEDGDVRTSTSSDGEFIFETDVPGTYLFEYSVNDGAEGGSESDTARIRVDVAPAEENDPPIAVRDDIVIASGETRTVFVLDNDGDPDGDVISIVDWSASPGLLIAEFNDGSGHIGFQVTATPTARRPVFSYSISDGVNDAVSAAVVVSLVGQGALDQPPFAVDDLIEMRSGTTITDVDVLSNDFDPEGGSLRIVRVGQIDEAQVRIAADTQSLTISVPVGATSSFTVPYDIEDEGGNRAAAILRVQLISPDAENRPPTARSDQARTSESDPIRIDVLRNDSDPDADAIALEGVADQPQNGIVQVTSDGILQYIPDPGFTGTDVFRYSIVDAPGERAFGDVFVGVTDQQGVNLPPIANDDSYTLAGVPSTTPLEVRENDFDPEGDPLRVVEVTPATVGSVGIDLFGRVEFIPPVRLGVATTVTFDYVISDTAGNRARATVSIELEAYEEAVEPTPPPVVETEPTPEPTPTPDALAPPPTPTPEPTPIPDEANDPPVAVNDERGPVPVGTNVEVRVLDNDFDPDGDEIELISVGAGASFVGELMFIDNIETTTQIEYTIDDGNGATATAVVTVLVIENQAPTVDQLSIETAYETPIRLDLGGQARDSDGDELVFICCEDRRNGAVTEVVSGPNQLSLLFTPDDGFSGQAAFSYRADDQNGHQTSGVVTVQVLPQGNQAPIVVDNSVQIPQGETVSVDLELLSSDPDGDPVTRFLGSSSLVAGSVIVSSVTAEIDMPRDVAVGPAGSFTFVTSDGVFESFGNITVEVIQGANVAPSVASTSIDLPAASSTTVDLASLTIDEDPGDSTTWELIDTDYESLSVSLSGGFMQVAAPASAVDTDVDVGFVATDTRGATGEGTVTVRVVGPIEPEPAAVNDSEIGNRGETTTISPLANDVDPLGQGLQIISVEPSWGTASVDGDTVQFNSGDRVGTSVIDYTVSDAAGREASAKISVEVVGPPDQPAPPGVSADSRRVTVEWTNPSANGRRITGYLITIDGGETRELPEQNSYVWDDLTNGETYSFTVTAVNEVGPSPESSPSLDATPNQVPDAPAPPTIEYGDRQLTVSWQVPNNDGSDILGYELEIGPSPEVKAVGAGTSFVWQGLNNGQDYTFRVRAENAGGFSSFSALSVPEHPATEPEPPTIGETIRGALGGTLTVNWSKPVDNGDEITQYEIRTGDMSRFVSGEDTISYDWAGLPTDGNEISFEVRAENRVGWSEWSGSSVGVPPCDVPDAPQNVTVVRGDREVIIDWDAAEPNGCLVTNYTISTIDGAVQNSESPGHTFTGLTNGETYQFEIRATNERGSGAPSAASAEVIPAGPPICPSNSAMNANLTAPKAIDLSWTAAINNGTEVREYFIDTDTSTISVPHPDTSYVVGSLSNDTLYNFSYTARNDVGVSPTCGAASETTWAEPQPITVTLSFDGDTEVLTASASGGDSSDTAPELGYSFELFRGSSSVDERSYDSGSSDGRSEEFLIEEDGTYEVIVRSVNAVDDVTASDSIEIMLASPPDQMTDDEIILTRSLMVRESGSGPLGTAVFVEFEEPANNGAEIIEYEWEARRKFAAWGDYVDIGSGTEPIATGDTQFQFDFLAGHSDYYNSVNEGRDVFWEVRARAVNSEGPSEEWSEWERMIVFDSEAPPATLSITEVGNCGSDGSCVVVDIDGYGFEPDSSYGSSDVRVRGNGLSTSCESVFTSSAGEIDDVQVQCNFPGTNNAPSSYVMRIDGVKSGNVQ